METEKNGTNIRGLVARNHFFFAYSRFISSGNCIFMTDKD